MPCACKIAAKAELRGKPGARADRANSVPDRNAQQIAKSDLIGSAQRTERQAADSDDAESEPGAGLRELVNRRAAEQVADVPARQRESEQRAARAEQEIHD